MRDCTCTHTHTCTHMYMCAAALQSPGVAGDPPHIPALPDGAGQGAEERGHRAGPGTVVEPGEVSGEEALHQSHQVLQYMLVY